MGFWGRGMFRRESRMCMISSPTLPPRGNRSQLLFLSLKSGPHIQKLNSPVKKSSFPGDVKNALQDEEWGQYRPTNLISKRASYTESFSSPSSSRTNQIKSWRQHLFYTRFGDSDPPRAVISTPPPPSSPCS